MSRQISVDGDLKNIDMTDPEEPTTTVVSTVALKEGDQVTVSDIDGATCQGTVDEIIYVVALDLESKRPGRS